MKGVVKIGIVRGIVVYLHWSFFVLLCFVVISEFADSASWMSALDELIMMLLVFFCVLLHEFGHALMAAKYNVRTQDITLFPIGGVARLERMPEKPIQELMVAIAGPLVNVAIILLILPVVLFGKGWPLAIDLEFLQENGLLVNLLLVNFSLLVFNLIPAFPMDGGRVLRALLAMKFSRLTATRIAAGLGMVLSLAFVVVGVFYNLILMLVGSFVFMSALTELRRMKTSAERIPKVIAPLLRSDYRIISKDLTLQQAMQELITGNVGFLVCSDEKQQYAVLSAEDIIRSEVLLGNQTAIADLPIVFHAGIPLSSTVEAAIGFMKANGCNAVACSNYGQIIGVISLHDIEIALRFSDRETD